MFASISVLNIVQNHAFVKKMNNATGKISVWRHGSECVKYSQNPYLPAVKCVHRELLITVSTPFLPRTEQIVTS